MEEPDGAFHQYITLLALSKGTLWKITEPIHRYLIVKGEVGSTVSLQYRQDLKERWMAGKDVYHRHRQANRFLSRLIELQAADWLEKRSWHVLSLEALGGEFDIEAESDHGTKCAIEVKYIASERWFLDLIIESGKKGASVATPSIYFTANYLLFRVFEASMKVAAYKGNRLCFIMVENWSHFEIPIEEQWVNWSSPTWVSAGSAWKTFFESQLGRYPEIDSEVPLIPDRLDELWLFTRNSENGLELKSHIVISQN